CCGTFSAAPQRASPGGTRSLPFAMAALAEARARLSGARLRRTPGGCCLCRRLCRSGAFRTHYAPPVWRHAARCCGIACSGLARAIDADRASMRRNDVALFHIDEACRCDQFRQYAIRIGLCDFKAIYRLHLPEEHPHQEGSLLAVVPDDEAAARFQQAEGGGEDA